MNQMEQYQLLQHGLRKKIIRQGTGQATPSHNEEVEIYYKAFNRHSFCFQENTGQDFPHIFVIGQTGNTKGLEAAVATMRKDQKAEFIVPSELAYGPSGFDEHVGAFEQIRYQIELKEFHQKRWQLSDEQMHRRVKELKEQGNQLFRQQKFKEAIQTYQYALKFLEYSFTAQSDYSKRILYLNLSGCHLKLADFRKVIHFTDKILQRDPDSIKTLYRRGQALIGLNQFQEAKRVLEKALSVEDTPQIRAQLRNLRQLNSKYEQQARKRSERMLGGLGY